MTEKIKSSNKEIANLSYGDKRLRSAVKKTLATKGNGKEFTPMSIGKKFKMFEKIMKKYKQKEL